MRLWRTVWGAKQRHAPLTAPEAMDLVAHMTMRAAIWLWALLHDSVDSLPTVFKTFLKSGISLLLTTLALVSSVAALKMQVTGSASIAQWPSLLPFFTWIWLVPTHWPGGNSGTGSGSQVRGGQNCWGRGGAWGGLEARGMRAMTQSYLGTYINR